jgi:hypothetical protein
VGGCQSDLLLHLSCLQALTGVTRLTQLLHKCAPTPAASSNDATASLHCLLTLLQVGCACHVCACDDTLPSHLYLAATLDCVKGSHLAGYQLLAVHPQHNLQGLCSVDRSHISALLAPELVAWLSLQVLRWVDAAKGMDWPEDHAFNSNACSARCMPILYPADQAGVMPVFVSLQAGCC